MLNYLNLEAVTFDRRIDSTSVEKFFNSGNDQRTLNPYRTASRYREIWL